MSNRQQRRNPTKQQLASEISRQSSQMANAIASLEQRLSAMEKGVDVITDAVLSTSTSATAAKAGDTVVVGFLGTLNGVPFQGGSSESFVIESLGAGTMVPGFEENILGMEPGNRKEFLLTFPKNYRPELAEKEVKFVVYLISSFSSNPTLLAARKEIQAAQNTEVSNG